jgi:phage tail-like protein
MSEAVVAITNDVPAASPAPGTAAPARGSDWLVGQLPAGMLSDDFFVRFVRIFQAQSETLLTHADSLPHLADPQLAPTEMVRYMAGWLGGPGIDDSYAEVAQRRILRTFARTLPWRGTRHGLTMLLELFSGAPASITDGGGTFEQDEAPDDVAWVRLQVASTGPLLEGDFLSLVLDEVPAHVRAEIVVGDRLIWPLPDTNPGGHG